MTTQTISRAELAEIIVETSRKIPIPVEYVSRFVNFVANTLEFGPNFNTAPACPATQIGFYSPFDNNEPRILARTWASMFDQVMMEHGYTRWSFYTVVDDV